ncbi:MAG: hypothetical protein IK066_04610 [Kiritimatiellae bacterium]|nr:hypothetical protein [Kiritimatiellia bacterium]
MLDVIWSLLQQAWEWIKQIWVKICRFVRNIAAWFRDPRRLRKLKEDRANLAVAIKQRLDSGEYQVVNCLFNEERSELVDPETDAEVINAGDLDDELEDQFGDNDMLVLT